MLKRLFLKIKSLFKRKKTPIEKDNTLPLGLKDSSKAHEFINPYAKEYKTLWETMSVKVFPEWYIKKIDGNKNAYILASDLCKVPWQIIAVIHMLECSGDLSRQILNGERWDRKTKLVPKGQGPFKSFAESCIMGFDLHRRYIPNEWNIENTLFFLEAWNGFGYRNYHGINSPYLWSFSNHYKSGKYVSDGKYDPNAVSKQCGAAVLLRELGYI